MISVNLWTLCARGFGILRGELIVLGAAIIHKAYCLLYGPYGLNILDNHVIC